MSPHLVKICGLRTFEAAEKAVDSGADLLGVILVPNKKRTVSKEVGKQISELARSHRQNKASANKLVTLIATQSYADTEEYFETVKETLSENGPYLVGVVQNQPIDEVFEIALEIGVDFIQLHGNENLQDYLKRNKLLGYPFGIIPRIVVPRDADSFIDFLAKDVINEGKYTGDGFILPLLDSEAGGEGKLIDWALVDELSAGKYLLAGGLNPHNLHGTKELSRVIGFDVSGGVEDASGNKDLEKIHLFVKNGKNVSI